MLNTKLLISMLGFPGGAMVKNLPASAGDARDMCLIPGLGWAPGEGNGLSSIFAWKNPTDKGAWRARVQGIAKSQTWLSAHVCARTYTHTHY